MIIFKDVITGDQMFTDSSKYKVVDGCLYEVACSHVQRRQGDIQLDGVNPSQEGEEDEGTEDLVESGFDIVLNQRLVETDFSKKKKSDYKIILRPTQNRCRINGTNLAKLTMKYRKLSLNLLKLSFTLLPCQSRSYDT
ncbi:translationally-controlled tumor protein homolog [Nephila pilipes]|uniref:Translationally-controlled tumor protein homolog n=1 Tax=Nephila pilipes TaxID=299642 RepID=A0A8X6P861_NEPPI|nr:translationally-controlled tumor protein homolog [Nephila pilipes]